jgi:hypothetical protein
MWEAVFADVGVSVIAILNALRVLKVKKWLSKIKMLIDKCIFFKKNYWLMLKNIV